MREAFGGIQQVYRVISEQSGVNCRPPIGGLVGVGVVVKLKMAWLGLGDLAESP